FFVMHLAGEDFLRAIEVVVVQPVVLRNVRELDDWPRHHSTSRTCGTLRRNTAQHGPSNNSHRPTRRATALRSTALSSTTAWITATRSAKGLIQSQLRKPSGSMSGKYRIGVADMMSISTKGRPCAKSRRKTPSTENSNASGNIHSSNSGMTPSQCTAASRQW